MDQSKAEEFFAQHAKISNITENLRGIAYLLKIEEVFVKYGEQYADEYNTLLAKQATEKKQAENKQLNFRDQKPRTVQSEATEEYKKP
jgi:hypothetical protein